MSVCTSRRAMILTLNPVSSKTSLAAAPSRFSPNSTSPPGIVHSPSLGGRRLFIRSTLSLRRTTAPAPTMGANGYSLLLANAKKESFTFVLSLNRAAAPVVSIEMLTVGKELLIGRTVNTNAHWVGGKLARLGTMLRRITTVDDNL